jgi:hypothetical protein
MVYGHEIAAPLAYGTWFRGWPLVEKLAEIEQMTADAPRLWLVMSHITPEDDDALVTGLQAVGYEVQAELVKQNAAAFLLVRQP